MIASLGPKELLENFPKSKHNFGSKPNVLCIVRLVLCNQMPALE